MSTKGNEMKKAINLTKLLAAYKAQDKAYIHLSNVEGDRPTFSRILLRMGVPHPWPHPSDDEEALRELAEQAERIAVPRWERSHERELKQSRTAYHRALDAFEELADKVQPVIDEEQKGARVRRLNAMVICSEIARIEKEIGLPKARLNGTIVEVQPFSNEYVPGGRYQSEGTAFTAINKRGQWVLIKVRREAIRSSRGVSVYLSSDAKEALLHRFDRF